MNNKLINNKRAQIFTIIAVLLIGLMFLSFEVFSVFQEKSTVKDRVSTMDSFLNSVEKNLERQMYIAGFRSIFLAQTEITETGFYISNMYDFFNESFFNGTVNGEPNNITIGATYNDILNSVNEKAAKINVNITLENTSVFLIQEDPWYVKFIMSSDFMMNDKQNLAIWQKQQNITAFVPVQGFIDPVYLLGSAGGVSRKILKTPYDGNFVNGGDYSNLADHYSTGYYANNSDAPSFLKRLEGDFSADPNGIETFVDIVSLSSGVKTTYDPSGTESVIDYLYFDLSDNTLGNPVPQVSSNLRIDLAHESRYQI